jgi:hypothetical protein
MHAWAGRWQISHLEQALAAKEATAREEGEKNVNLTAELHKTLAELSKAHEATQEKLSATEDALSIAQQQGVVSREQARVPGCLKRMSIRGNATVWSGGGGGGILTHCVVVPSLPVGAPRAGAAGDDAGPGQVGRREAAVTAGTLR